MGAVVILVVHASESVKIVKVVAGNQQENARGIVNRSGVHVKFSIFTLMVSIVLFFSKIENEKLFHHVIIKIKSLKDDAKIYSQKNVYECIKFHYFFLFSNHFFLYSYYNCIRIINF